MKIRRAALALISAIGITAASNSYSWEIERNFNSSLLNTTLSRVTTGFDDAATSSIVSTEKVFEGNSSAKLQITKGATGFGSWGGIIDFDGNVYSGGDIWLEFYMYIPSEFQINTAGNGSLKFIRLKSSTSTGGANGYIDIQLADDSQGGYDFRMLRENQAIWYPFGGNGILTKNKWHRINVHVKVGDKPVASGGTSYIEFWLNGSKIAKEDRIMTSTQKGDYFNSLYLFTYWNGSAPANQHLYIDDLSMANTRPAWADNLGSQPMPDQNPPAAPALKISQL